MSIFDDLVASTADDRDDSDWSHLTVGFDQIPPIPATYLWPGVIPNRTPVLFVAPGGTGKGLLMARITAITTTGEPFPGETAEREPGQVIIVAPEDDANEDLSFRLIAAGADRALVRDLTLLPNGGPFTLPGNIPELRKAISEASSEGPPVRLVVLDPLLAICEDGLASQRAARAVIWPLQEVAQSYGGALLLSHHTTKNERVVAGNKVLTDSSRLVWMISHAQDDPAAREMRVWKTNRRAHAPLRFRIEGEDEEARAVFVSGNDSAPGSRAAKLRLSESPEEMARRWLAEHPKEKKENENEEEVAAA